MKPNYPIGLGTAAIGRPMYINVRQQEAKEYSLDEFKAKGMALLDIAYDLGIRYFDTAPGYGMAERMLIDWVRERKPENIEIASKWGYTYVANFDPNATVHEVKEHSVAKLNEQWETSKSLLPYLKYYQIHSAVLATKVLTNEKVLDRLNQLKEEQGLIVGLTTTGSNQMEVIKRALEIERGGIQLFDLVQVTYNVFDQGLANLASQFDVKWVIKEALANGRIFPNANFAHYGDAYKLLGELANKYGAGVDAIALRFCLDSIPVFRVLSGAATEEHLKSNLRMADFVLEEKDVERLRSLAISPTAYWEERKQLDWN